MEDVFLGIAATSQGTLWELDRGVNFVTSEVWPCFDDTIKVAAPVRTKLRYAVVSTDREMCFFDCISFWRKLFAVYINVCTIHFVNITFAAGVDLGVVK